MAEAFFNKYSRKSKAESAALIHPQNHMHRLVIKAMKEKGVDITKNISKKVTREMINKTKLIILMESKLRSYLSTDKKIEVWDIPEIIAKETDEHLYSEFVKARDIIEDKVKELLEKIE